MYGPRGNRSATGRLAATIAAAAMLLAACGGSSSTATSSSSTPSSSAPAASSSAAASSSKSASPSSAAASSKASGAAASSGAASGGATAAGPAVVGTTTGALGTYLVDGAGKTLYMFDTDQTAPGTSTCYNACATAWPPLETKGAATVTGTAAADKLSTITRTDGSTQVVYGEYPLYYWAKDTAAGQTTGQGVAGTWWVVGIDGEPIKTAG